MFCYGKGDTQPGTGCVVGYVEKPTEVKTGAAVDPARDNETLRGNEHAASPPSPCVVRIHTRTRSTYVLRERLLLVLVIILNLRTFESQYLVDY